MKTKQLDKIDKDYRNTLVRYTKKEILKEGSFYENLWEKHPELLKYSEKEIYEILKSFNSHLSEVVGSTRDGISLPLYMGVVFAGIYGKSDNTKDRATSLKLEKDITYPNHHTDGYGGMVYYVTEVTKSRFSLGKYWGFDGCKYMAQEAKKGFKTNWKIYATVPSVIRAARLFRKSKLKEYAQAKGKEAEELYNEFDFDEL